MKFVLQLRWRLFSRQAHTLKAITSAVWEAAVAAWVAACPSFSAPRGPSGPGMGANTIGSSRGLTSRGPTGGIYNYAPTENPSRSGGTTFSRNHDHFTGRDERGERDLSVGRDRGANFRNEGIARRFLRTRTPFPLPSLLAWRMGVP